MASETSRARLPDAGFHRDFRLNIDGVGGERDVAVAGRRPRGSRSGGREAPSHMAGWFDHLGNIG